MEDGTQVIQTTEKKGFATPVGFAQMALAAFEFNKMIVLGLLLLVLVDKLVAFYLATHVMVNIDVNKLILDEAKGFTQMVLAGVLGFLTGKGQGNA